MLHSLFCESWQYMMQMLTVELLPLKISPLFQYSIFITWLRDIFPMRNVFLCWKLNVLTIIWWTYYHAWHRGWWCIMVRWLSMLDKTLSILGTFISLKISPILPPMKMLISCQPLYMDSSCYSWLFNYTAYIRFH